MNKLRSIELFAGCGGLVEGFEQTGNYELLAAVEWEKAPRNTLVNRLKNYWNIQDAEARTLLFDIQQTDRLFSGWQADPKYGDGLGIDTLVGTNKVDVIVGGPPCQAYSIAGRIRDEHGMRDDYRNFLFESYIKVVDKYKPKAFIFENVPGLLSAKPTGVPVVNIIRESFKKIGYVIPTNLHDALVNMAEFGLPQYRRRLIILGLSQQYFGDSCEVFQKIFYNTFLQQYKIGKYITVNTAIGDLPKLLPIDDINAGKKVSHTTADTDITDHISRFHSKRDVGIFRELALDIKNGENKYTSVEAIKKLYTDRTGHTSKIHKYHVLRENEPSCLIPAHLYKDGLRHIHPDPEQARTITVREAARLQGFPDDFIFLGSMGDKYKMIGNAVPPFFAKIIAQALYHFFKYADKFLH